MQTAQINSPRFGYQVPAPMAVTVPHTLDDFRPVHGSYAGSFSGKSMQPWWIAAGMIATVAAIAIGVNMYSESHIAKIDAATSAPNHRLPAAPAAPTAAAVPAEAPAAIDKAATDSQRTSPKSEEAIVKPSVGSAKSQSGESVSPVKPRSSVAGSSAPVAVKKVAPSTTAPLIAPPQPELVAPSPPIQEPLPTPAPIIEEKPILVAPKPLPDAPQVEPPKM